MIASIERLRAHACQLLANATTTRWLEREVAFIIDVIIVALLSVFPRVGFFFGLLYFLFRDSLPFGAGCSFGKSLYRLVVANSDSAQSRANWRKTLIRNIIYFIPILNLVDIYYFLRSGRRLIDIWLEIDVVSRTEE